MSVLSSWGKWFNLLLPQAAVLLGSDAGCDGVEPASSFIIQNVRPRADV